ncbi:hypothetical protein M8C21_001382, partial [Ambrosia artemisiifolia]
MDENVKTVVFVARWGRSVYINIQKFVQFQLTVNVVAVMANFVTYTYSERDVALHALGIGACAKDALDDKELKNVYHEDGQQSIKANLTQRPELKLVNTGKERAQVSLLLAWANLIGGISHLSGDHVNEPFIGEDGVSEDENDVVWFWLKKGEAHEC